MKVTALGTISVDRMMKKATFRPGTAMRASAYPAIEAKSVWSTRLTSAMIAEFRNPLPIGARGSSKRRVKLLHCADSAHHFHSNPVISGWVIRALRRIR